MSYSPFFIPETTYAVELAQQAADLKAHDEPLGLHGFAGLALDSRVMLSDLSLATLTRDDSMQRHG